MPARTRTIDELITSGETECDIENDAHISTAQKFDLMNRCIAETWDKIIECGQGDKYVKVASFNTVSGTRDYDLFTVASDFYKVSQVVVVENTQERPLRRVNFAEMRPYTPPQTTVPVKLYYIPYSPILTTGQSFDGINGWEEYAILLFCMKVKMKKDDSYNQYANRLRMVESRMKMMGDTDFAEPVRVVRKRYQRVDPWLLYTNSLNAYTVRGNNLSLLYDAGIYIG
jgi:hypothetical protein